MPASAPLSRTRAEIFDDLYLGLPAGGALPEDYVFAGVDGPVNLSQLFAPGRDTLAVYSFMFGPERARPCPGCTHFLDGFDGTVEHVTQRVNLAIVAKSPLPRILAFAHPDFEAVIHPELSAEPDTYRGHEGVRRYFESFADAMDEVRFEPQRFWDAGDAVVVGAKVNWPLRVLSLAMRLVRRLLISAPQRKL